jgi:hypothetical protein
MSEINDKHKLFSKIRAMFEKKEMNIYLIYNVKLFQNNEEFVAFIHYFDK